MEIRGERAVRSLGCCGTWLCEKCARELFANEDCCPACFAPVGGEHEDVEAWVSSLGQPTRVVSALLSEGEESDSTWSERGSSTDSSPPKTRLAAFLASTESAGYDNDERGSGAEAEEVDSEALNGARMRLTERAASITQTDAASRIAEVCLSSRAYNASPGRVRRLFEARKQLPLADALALLTTAREILSLEPNVLDLEAPLLCVGDLHGQFEDLLTVLHGEGRDGGLLEARRRVSAPRYLLDGRHERRKKKRGSVLFLGDYVDRGSRGCEVFLYLLALKIRYPAEIHLIRGNHESRSLTGHFGFRAECRRKYGLSCYHEICRVFEALPLAARVRGADYGSVLCCHGGLGPNFETVEDIQALDRFVEPPDDGALCDVLWADPQRGGGSEMFEPNPTRGCSYVFGREATRKFLRKNNLVAIVRAHEVQEDGYFRDFSVSSSSQEEEEEAASIAPVTTVFSAPNYCGKYGNDAAVLVLGLKTASPVVFDAAPRAANDPVLSPKDEELSSSESDAVRKAYEICPYMPSSFRAIVASAKDMLDDNAILVKKVAAAIGTPPAPPSPQINPRVADLRARFEPPDTPVRKNFKTVKPPVAPPEEPVTATKPHTLEVILVKNDTKSRRFTAALNGDKFNEMAPSAVVRRVRRTSCPQLAAFLANTNLVDSGGSGKNTILDAQSAKITHHRELVQVRDELRASRRLTSSPVNRALYERATSRAHSCSPQQRRPPARRRLSDWMRPDGSHDDGFSDKEVYALRLIFSLFDIDGSGSISRDELASYAEEVDECVSPRDVSTCFAALDADGDKSISLDDWVAFAAKLKAAWQLLHANPN
ncbi:hypothetical protein CTAYLR_005852 [Chrysophaeum taylorii]|uniref:Serine/threonine-protein phosphatase n=1 Tax=Chrysophaeum taylorii TaxID=2483200 RepID=A0AAD7UQG0_9STRA|nr:hypothetical protein CTAYLR_005852 [Chrysophaeum taylorii]